MTKLTLLINCALLASCACVGPELVSDSRSDYNVVLRQADDQQMLLDLDPVADTRFNMRLIIAGI